MHTRFSTVLSGLAVLCLCLTNAVANQDFDAQRRTLVKEIEADVTETSLYIGRTRLNDRVLAAMAEVPRHEFVPKNVREQAYLNRPLPIGYSQTISQPYIVALMTDLLDVDASSRVLEVGTGSGYQAAILARLCRSVFSIEIIEPLGKRAKGTLKTLGYGNVEVRIGDGYYGWQEHAPYDAIVVTAAANHVPPPLVRQLKPGGRMIIPVGGRFAVQHLVLVRKNQHGEVTSKQILPVRFVPLTGGH